MLIRFIPGKGISTKAISDWNIMAHFEIPQNTDANQYINRPLTLVLDGGVEFDCSVSTEGSSYYYNGTHKTYAMKLEIFLTDILAMGLIFKSQSLSLTVK